MLRLLFRFVMRAADELMPRTCLLMFSSRNFFFSSPFSYSFYICIYTYARAAVCRPLLPRFVCATRVRRLNSSGVFWYNMVASFGCIPMLLHVHDDGFSHAAVWCGSSTSPFGRSQKAFFSSRGRLWDALIFRTFSHETKPILFLKLVYSYIIFSYFNFNFTF